MSGLISHGKLVLVERDAGGFDIGVFNDHLHMIESLINTGCIGDNIYGTPAHLDALSHLEGEIAVVRGKIMKHNAMMPEFVERDPCPDGRHDWVVGLSKTTRECRQCRRFERTVSGTYE